MTHHTHVALSLNALLLILVAVVYAFGMVIYFKAFGIVLCGVVLGSLLPDIDEPESYIGKRTLFLSDGIEKLFGHRGASHFLIVPFLLLTIAIFTKGFLSLVLFGLAFGYFFHIIGDMLTLSGIQNVFFPFGNKRRFYALLPQTLRFKTNSNKEHILSVFLGISLCSEWYLLYKMGGLL